MMSSSPELFMFDYEALIQQQHHLKTTTTTNTDPPPPHHHHHHSPPSIYEEDNYDSSSELLCLSAIDSILQSQDMITNEPTNKMQQLLSAAEDYNHQITTQSILLSNSPPISHQMGSLSLTQKQQATPPTQTQLMIPNSSSSSGKFDYPNYNSSSSSCLLGNEEERVMIKLMSYSYGLCNHNVNLNQPNFDPLFGFELQAVGSPDIENTFSSSSHQMIRRVFSTGDLPKKVMNSISSSSSGQQEDPNPTVLLSSTPMGNEIDTTFNIEEEPANFKVGKYSAEERKQRIDRYRAKRTHRNFNKTIKYACRKTLADSRPRIRGRFARNDDTPAGLTKLPSNFFNPYQDEDDLWNIEGLHEDEEEATVIVAGAGDELGRRPGATHHFYQYSGY